MTRTKPFDEQAYIERITTGPCFICEMLAGNSDYAHHVIHRDDHAVVLLNKYPTRTSFPTAPRPLRLLQKLTCYLHSSNIPL